MNNIRKSAMAGAWYPDKPQVLKTNIADFFNQVPEEIIDGQIIGLVAPHAGYVYSGHVAAYAYKLISGQIFDAVIVIGPSHRVPFRGVSVYDRGGFETPLGTVPIDSPLAKKIMLQNQIISATPHAHLQEHSIEIQLPFLQVALGDFSFVPLLMGSQDRRTCEALAGAIFTALEGRRTLVVGSSDLSHFHNYNKAVTIDALVLKRISDLDHDGLLEDMENNVSEACGGGPVAVSIYELHQAFL
ncbi:MAG: AmmeMemoRadiSam system protein B [Syntrophales bacterium LBB04]|nr:AmmeMemoRadiSam system protein B [Syntrophales bacterium LBB04]